MIGRRRAGHGAGGRAANRKRGIAMWTRFLGAVALAAVAATAVAQDLPQTTIRFIGNTSSSYIWTEAEKTFIGRTVPDAGKGRVRIEGVPHDQAGLRGPEILGLLQNGTLQFASYSVSYMAGDDPRFEGIDLAGLTLNAADARKVVNAYRPVVARLMAEKFGVHLLALAPSPAQVFWCRIPITGIQDLKGRKIRVFNPSLADFVAGLGGTSVTIPFVEMIPAMQRGVADCAITGTLNGNTARLPEVTTHLYPMQAGWSVLFWAVNAQSWRALDPAVRGFLDTQFKSLESTIWGLGEEIDQDGIACSTGGACKRGRPYRMTLVPVTAEAMGEHGRILRDSVVANWAKRCGRACAEEWNQTVGKVVGITAPTAF